MPNQVAQSQGRLLPNEEDSLSEKTGDISQSKKEELKGRVTGPVKPLDQL
jgi:hypothetical protein